MYIKKFLLSRDLKTPAVCSHSVESLVSNQTEDESTAAPGSIGDNCLWKPYLEARTSEVSNDGCLTLPDERSCTCGNQYCQIGDNSWQPLLLTSYQSWTSREQQEYVWEQQQRYTIGESVSAFVAYKRPHDEDNSLTDLSQTKRIRSESYEPVEIEATVPNAEKKYEPLIQSDWYSTYDDAEIDFYSWQIACNNPLAASELRRRCIHTCDNYDEPHCKYWCLPVSDDEDNKDDCTDDEKTTVNNNIKKESEIVSNCTDKKVECK